MGTSRSGSVGSSTRWKVTSDDLKALADAALVGIALSIPQVELSETKKKGGGASVPEPAGNLESSGRLAAGIGAALSIPQSAAGAAPAPRTIRGLGKRLFGAALADERFAPEMGGCAVKVAINLLLGLFSAATLKYRTQRDTDKLFAEYGISGARNFATALLQALDQRYREDLVKKCKKGSNNAEQVRLAMNDTLIDMLSPDGTARAYGKLNADGIHAALRKTHSLKIVESFYVNYLHKTARFIISSLHADITIKAEKYVIDGLRPTYCDYVAKEVVKRAGEKGWRPSEIPDKAEEWADLLIEEEVHA